MTQGLVVATVAGSDNTALKRTKALVDELSVGPAAGGSVTVKAGGPEGANNAITNQIVKDLQRAEGIAIPVTFVLLVVAFGTVLAAALPVAMGLLAIVATLAVLFLLGSVTDVSIYALNLTTALGLGLAIDYALLMVNRYREELASGMPVTAVRRAVATAGRTIVFSAATVAAALAALLVFPVYFLRSFAYAGISVVALATVAALDRAARVARRARAHGSTPCGPEPGPSGPGRVAVLAARRHRGDAPAAGGRPGRRCGAGRAWRPVPARAFRHSRRPGPAHQLGCPPGRRRPSPRTSAPT